jgi:hypothetical protein
MLYKIYDFQEFLLDFNELILDLKKQCLYNNKEYKCKGNDQCKCGSRN